MIYPTLKISSITNMTRLTCVQEHPRTINVLNTHTGILPSNRKIATPKFFNAFSNFISLFEKSKFDESFHEKMEVTHAYEKFLSFTKKEVKRVKPKKCSGICLSVFPFSFFFSLLTLFLPGMEGFS